MTDPKKYKSRFLLRQRVFRVTTAERLYLVKGGNAVAGVKFSYIGTHSILNACIMSEKHTITVTWSPNNDLS
jgi:hypothetical protein